MHLSAAEGSDRTPRCLGELPRCYSSHSRVSHGGHINSALFSGHVTSNAPHSFSWLCLFVGMLGSWRFHALHGHVRCGAMRRAKA